MAKEKKKLPPFLEYNDKGKVVKKASGPSKKKDDISIDPKNEGKFTKWVEKNMPGKSTCSAAMKSKKKYSSSVVKMANYANNFGCKK